MPGVAALSQDTIRVQADNPPIWGTTLRLVKQLEIGSVDGPPEYSFGTLELFATFKDGGFAIYDSKDVQVRCYSAAGKFVANFGRKGDGPGEYQLLMGMGTVADSLVVWDVRHRRATYFTRAGKVTRQQSIPSAQLLQSDGAFAVDTQGTL
jgi:hypothetical protein